MKRSFANDNISDDLKANETEEIKAKLEEKFKEIMQILKIDSENDHNTKDTPRRVAKMWVDEVFAGRYQKAPAVTQFPNESGYDGLLLVGPIAVRSMCSHHLVPIHGTCYVGVHPSENILGLSKYNRIVDWFCRRPQIQEELTHQIAKYLYDKMHAKGIAVYIKAKHYCMSHRGVTQDSDTTTSMVLGSLREDKSMKSEFFELVSRQDR